METDTSLKSVVSVDDLEWKAFQIPGSQGYEFKFKIIGEEYTNAYSMDLVRIAPGGFSPTHLDRDNHAFYIISGHGEIVIADQVCPFGPGSVVKIPVDVLHSVKNTGDEAVVFLTIYDPPRQR